MIKRVKYLFVLGAVSLAMLPNICFAAASFTDILDTPSFAGTWEWVNKFDFIGGILQFVITAVCVFGLVGIIFRVMMSLLYLSNRTLFNEIHEIKQMGVQNGESGVKGAFGMLPMWKDVAQGHRGSGVDAIVAWVFTLLPDIKKYSDYSEDAKGYSNLDAETDSVGRYMLNTFIPVVLLIFFFTMGFNGTLVKAYGTVVDGMSVVADRLVNINLEGAVARAIDSGENYSFAFDSGNTQLGDLQQKVANSMYLQILGRTAELDNNYKNAVGKAIDSFVNENITIEKVEGYIKQTLSEVQQENVSIKADDDLRGVKFDIIINTTEKNMSGGKELGLDVPISQFVTDAGGASEYFMHLVFTKDRVSTGGYFTTKATE